MPEIRANEGVVTQINVFTVKPENQQHLVDVLIAAANSVKDMPGWMSASLHKSLDGTKVVNYAQCTNYEAWEAIMEKLVAGGHIEKNKEFGSANPGLYKVVYTLQAGE